VHFHSHMTPISSTSRRLPRPLALAAAALVAVVAGCATVDTYLPTLRSFGVYKMDINQGNYLSQDMVDKLKAGQTKQQVRQLLGTPLLVSIYRENRWDYPYMFMRQGRIVEQRTFTVYFVDDKLARWEGDEMPASVVELNRVASSRVAGESNWADERSWFEKLLDFFQKK
jgi:outer membrane protein assembly factor BamE